jgi:hypothetical protein
MAQRGVEADAVKGKTKETSDGIPSEVSLFTA